MEVFIERVLVNYGVGPAIIILFLWWLIWHVITPWIKNAFASKKDNKKDKENTSSNTNNTNVTINNGNIKSDGVYSKEDMIYDTVKELQSSIKLISSELNTFKEETHKQFAYIDSRLEDTKVETIVKGYTKFEEIKSEMEQKLLLDNLRLGEESYKILRNYVEKINCSHIFVGSFHNGTNSLTGAPYFKFDIIKELQNPNDIQKDDHEFAHMYHNNPLSLYDKLPLTLITEEMLYFNTEIPESKEKMEKLDPLIIRRMIGTKIQQIALHVTYDDGMLSGFVGCVKYNQDKLDLDQLKLCVKDLELLYSKNKKIYK